LNFEYKDTLRTLDDMVKASLTLNHKTILRLFGTVGAGKGTISNRLSDFFDIPAVDSGAIWRSVTYGYLQDPSLDISSENNSQLFKRISMKPEGNSFVIYFDNKLLTNDDLRNKSVDSKVSAVAEYRDTYDEFLSDFLDEYNESVVLDGRAGETRYIKHAREVGYTIIKIYLFSSIEAAAHRRALEYQKRNPNIEFESALQEISDNIQWRDETDYNRAKEQDHMGWVDDATFALDTTDLTIDEVFETVLWRIYTIQN